MRISDWSSYVCSSDLSASPALKTDDVRRRDGGSMDAHDIAPCPLRLIAREVRAAQRVAGGGGGRRDGGDADAGGHRVKIRVLSDRHCGHAVPQPNQYRREVQKDELKSLMRKPDVVICLNKKKQENYIT